MEEDDSEGGECIGCLRPSLRFVIIGGNVTGKNRKCSIDEAADLPRNE